MPSGPDPCLSKGAVEDDAALFHAVVRRARERPDATAVSFNAQTLSYGELDARSNRLAHYLRREGAGAGARVAVCLEPSLDIAVSILGIFKSGAAYVPMDPTYPLERQAVLLEDINPRILLTQTHLRKRLPYTPAIVLESSLDHGLADEVGALASLPATPVDWHVSLADPAFIVYTSGTTGKPKGVIMTHGNLVHYLQLARERYGFDQHAVQPAMARFSFSISMFEILSPLIAGGRLIILERDHVLDFKQLLATLEGATVLHASPSLLRKLLAYIQHESIDCARLDGLRHVSSGGDLVSADLMEALKRTFRKAELFVIYGCSEIACMGCTYQIPRDQTVTRSWVGRPFSKVPLRICDAQGNLVPTGVPGEIFIGGAGVALGYLDRPELTQERFLQVAGERFYRTGDIGRYDDVGNVEMLGRSDFQVKLRGIRIELGEIESVLRGLAGVRETVVVARDLNGEKALVAYLVLDPGLASDVKAIRGALQAKLPDYMVPAAFVVLPALPLNLNQKLDRQALPAPSEEDLARLRSLVPPRDSLETELVGLWKDLLHTSSPIGVEDSFFDVGGDSLLAVSPMVEIEKRFGMVLPLSTLLTDPTVAALARILRDGRDRERASMVLLREGGNLPPIFFIHDGEGEILPYRTLAMKLGARHPVYGIQPKSRGQFPMLHTRLAEVVDYYTHLILAVQASGPYFLGGLCIGGFIAFEIANRLQAMGHSIGMIALIDVAHVKTRPKSATSQRLKRFSAAMKHGQGPGGRRPVLRLLRESSRRIRNVLRYEASSRFIKARRQGQMRLFRAFLDHGWSLPPFLAHISVNTVLRFAEKEYVVPDPFQGQALLFRATRKSSAFDGTLIDDTPYMDLFEDPMLGWEGKTTRGVQCFDIPAGHSSMLQLPHVDLIAAKMQMHIDTAVRVEKSTVPGPALVDLSDQRERPRTAPDELQLALPRAEGAVELPAKAPLPGRI